MSLIFCESFQSPPLVAYPVTGTDVEHVLWKWDVIDNAYVSIVDTYNSQTPPFGNQMLRVHGDGAKIDFGAWGSGTKELALGFWINYHVQDSWSNQYGSFQFGSDSGTKVYFSIQNSTDNIFVRMTVNHGGSSTTVGEIDIDTQTWYWINCVYSVANGTVELFIDDEETPRLIYDDTAGLDDEMLTYLHLRSSTISRANFLAESVVIIDTSDAVAPNTRPQPMKVDYIPLDAQGVDDDLAAEPSSKAKTDILEEEADFTQFVSSDIVGHRDSYVTGLDGPYAILGVQVSALAKKAGTDAWNLAPIVRRDGTVETGATEDLTTTEGVVVWTYEQDPHTLAEWKVGDFRNSELGFEVGQTP